MTSPDELLDAIRRILNDDGSAAADAAAIQAELIDGRLRLTRAAQTVSAGRDIDRSVIFIGSGHQVQIGLDEQRLEALRQRVFPETRGVLPPYPSSLFIGRAKEMLDIRKLLAPDKGLGLVLIVGLAGIGKTTTMSALRRDGRLLKHYPDGVLWTSLGKSPNLFSVLSSWGAALGNDSILRSPTLELASQQLANLLRSKKMLLLVDDVWDASHLDHFLAAKGSECMVATTTRQGLVAERFTSTRNEIYRLPLLDEPHAVDLFQAIAPEVARDHPAESRDLVRILEYLPLSIHVAARLLSIEAKFDWGIGDLMESIKSGVAVLAAMPPEDRPESSTVSALLQSSTDLLSEPVRERFAYLGVFPSRPATFDLEALKAVWEVDDPRPTVRELVGHGLLEPVGKGRFQMHALLVAHAHSMLQDG